MNRLVHWEGVAVDEWRVRWDLPELVMLDEVGSTNDIARKLAQDGAPAGLVVMTEYQSAGRGTKGREWSATRSQSLLFSILLRPNESPAGVAPGTAPIRVGMAIARALRDAAGIDAFVKWPNDVVVGDRKLAGVLCEAVTTGTRTSIVAGVGINVLQREGDWPDAVRATATSVANLSHGVSRSAVMTAVCAALQPLHRLPLRTLDPGELSAWAAVDALVGRQVSLDGAERIHGRASGIDSDGALLVEMDGVMRRVTSATVRPIEPLPHPTMRER